MIDASAGERDGYPVQSMRSFGRLLQFLGLAAPPLAIILQMAGSISLGLMLIMAVAAIAAFYLGRIIEGYTSS